MEDRSETDVATAGGAPGGEVGSSASGPVRAARPRGSRVIVAAGALLSATLALTLVSLVIARSLGHLSPGVLPTLGLQLVALCGIALPLTLGWLILAQVRRRVPRAAAAVAAIVGALVVAAPWVILGAELVSGDWIQRQTYAPLLRVVAPALGILTVASLSVLLEVSRRRPAMFVPVSWACVVAGLSGALADALVFPGLYPWPHKILYLHSGMALLVGLARLLEAPTGRLGRRSAPVAGGLLALSLLLLPAGLSPTSIARAGLLSVAETPAEVVLPWLPQRDHGSIDRALLHMPSLPGTEKGEVHPWHGRARSVILVVVDNLRADALPPVRNEESPLVKPGDTPFLDQWLGGQFRARRAYSQASATARSVPAMHRSVLPWEGVAWEGLSLPELASHYDLSSVAILPEYFVFPTNPHAQSLPDGFDHLEIYTYARQQELVRKADRVLTGLGDERFIAWVHFFCVHQPGSFHGHLLSHRDGDSFFRYRRGVAWLDTQMRILVENLRKRGLQDSTAIILTADHGDEKRQTGLGHGQFVSEQELHVPFAISVPGARGRLIGGPVSNIDVLPTALDLLGLPPHPTHRGRSLLPLLSGETEQTGRIAYAESANGGAMALYSGRYKLVFSPKEGAYSVFDVERDPRGLQNLFGRDKERDDQLLAEMVRRKPAAFASELTGAQTLAILAERLAQADADWPPSDVRLLARLAALSEDPRARDAAFALFDRTPRSAADPEGRGLSVRVEVLSALREVAPEETAGRIAREIEGEDDPSREAAFVAGLADHSYGEFSPALVAERLLQLTEEAPERRRAWLRLIAPWDKSADVFLEPLSQLRGPVSSDAISLAWWLRNLATLQPGGAPSSKSRPLSPKLGGRVVRFLRHSDGRVQFQAARALGVLGGNKAIKGLRRLLRQGRADPPTHEAALVSLVALQGRGAMDVLLGQDPRSPHVLTVVRTLRKLEDPRGIPMLKKIRQVSTSQTSRKEAGLALAHFEKLERTRRP